MGNDVFANGREVSCKAADGKSICAFPDVCMTPPENPATPPGVPVPYPNTGMASDTTSGSKTVKVSNKEVMLKNKSYFKKSVGDEAGCAAKKGVVTSTNRGKVYFTSWSMDVKFEGENVVRHLDMTTHNHASFPSNTTPWPYADAMAFGPGGPCENVDEKFKLVPYQTRDKDTGKSEGTCKPLTGHHLIPGRCMQLGTTPSGNSTYPKGCSHGKAPVVCVNNENQHDGTHRDCHAVFDPIELAEGKKTPKGKITYKKASDAAAKSAKGINNNKELTQEEQDCVKLQLDNYYKNCLRNKDGSVKKNAQLVASEEPHGGLVLPKLNSTGGLG